MYAFAMTRYKPAASPGTVWLPLHVSPVAIGGRFHRALTGRFGRPFPMIHQGPGGQRQHHLAAVDPLIGDPCDGKRDSRTRR